MNKIKSWIQASRPRTLPLSLSGILVGIALQWEKIRLNPWVAIGCLFTTIFFQILSNLANDYGDGVRGTDNENRVGPTRAIQSGMISVRSMKYAIVLLCVFSAISASVTIALASSILNKQQIIFYGILAITCIAAAILYTVGKLAYGYRGFGDVMVFLFFGVVAVLGTMNLFPNAPLLQGILGAITIGCWSTLVLNLNNLRDAVNDRNNKKITLVVKLGIKSSRLYHQILIYVGSISWLTLILIKLLGTNQYAYFLAIIPQILIIKHHLRFRKIVHEGDYDPELKKVAIATFIHAFLLLIASFLAF